MCADFFTGCNLCPRNCRADRVNSVGFCGAYKTVRIARAALHHWEEPCISGTRGSGAVFFCGCNLKCVYCQNIEISHGTSGKEISEKRLGEIFLNLEELGAHNINLVTPTHYIPQIINAVNQVRDKLHIPIIYNCGGYESSSGLSLINGLVDIYLTDIKYADDTLAAKYSSADNYCDISFSALRTMLNSVGEPILNSDGIMQKGVIVRHLSLPSHRYDSVNILKRLKSEFGTKSFILSLMSQYTPNGNLEKFPELNRRITSFEYNYVTNAALDLGFTTAYTQERSSASSSFTPPFDLTGV